MSKNRNSVKKKTKSVKGILLILLALILTYCGGSDYVKEKMSEAGLGQEQTETQTQTEDNEAALKGVVTQVSDGDTVILKDGEGKTYKVRLNGIDAPEMGQAYGEESKAFLEKMVLNKSVEIESVGVDQYKRVLGVVFVSGFDVNKTMLENGLAWQYKYNKDESYGDLMNLAKKQKKNIWSDPNAMDPHTWRKQNRR